MATKAQAKSEFVSGLAGGAAQRITKDLVLHPIDTVKTRLQRKGATFSRRVLLDPYAGVLGPLVVGVPAGALFFGVKDATVAALEGLNEDLVEVLAVSAANLPYWLVRSPAELVKVRQQLQGGQALGMAREIFDQGGIQALYTGALESYTYALPTDLVKFVTYRKLKSTFPQYTGVTKKAGLGSLASATAQLVTTPLDVVRTRAMDAGASSLTITDRARAIFNDEGVPALFAGLAPRLLRSLVSGGLQFGSYEFTKRLFN